MTMEWHNNNITFGKLQQLVQGDHSGCSLGVVDIKRCAFVYKAYTETQPLFPCQPKLGNNLNDQSPC